MNYIMEILNVISILENLFCIVHSETSPSYVVVEYYFPPSLEFLDTHFKKEFIINFKKDFEFMMNLKYNIVRTVNQGYVTYMNTSNLEDRLFITSTPYIFPNNHKQKVHSKEDLIEMINSCKKIDGMDFRYISSDKFDSSKHKKEETLELLNKVHNEPITITIQKTTPKYKLELHEDASIFRRNRSSIRKFWKFEVGQLVQNGNMFSRMHSDDLGSMVDSTLLYDINYNYITNEVPVIKLWICCDRNMFKNFRPLLDKVDTNDIHKQLEFFLKRKEYNRFIFIIQHPNEGIRLPPYTHHAVFTFFYPLIPLQQQWLLLSGSLIWTPELLLLSFEWIDKECDDDEDKQHHIERLWSRFISSGSDEILVLKKGYKPKKGDDCLFKMKMFVHNENKHGSKRVSEVVGRSVFTGKESYFLSDSFLKFKPSYFPVPTNPLTCSTKKSDREIRNMNRKKK